MSKIEVGMLMLPASSNCAALADWCRVLRHQLAAGVSLKTIGRNLTMSGPASLRLMSGDVQQAIEEGRSIADGLKPYAARLPGIFVPLVAVGEKTGNLPETLSELETYLRQQDQFVREFRKQTMLPKFQLFAAIFIVAGLIYILGQITTNRGTPATPIFGLSGTTGALIFLACTLGPIVAILLWVRRFTGDYRRQAMVQAKLLKLPAIGPCLRVDAEPICACLAPDAQHQPVARPAPCGSASRPPAMPRFNQRETPPSMRSRRARRCTRLFLTCRNFRPSFST